MRATVVMSARRRRVALLDFLYTWYMVKLYAFEGLVHISSLSLSLSWSCWRTNCPPVLPSNAWCMVVLRVVSASRWSRGSCFSVRNTSRTLELVSTIWDIGRVRVLELLSINTADERRETPTVEVSYYTSCILVTHLPLAPGICGG